MTSSSKRVDLHVHSTASDGTVPPGDLGRLAAAAGLSAFALTDHDTLAGVAAAREGAARHGVEVVAGVELSVQEEGHDVHLLGYLVNEENERLQAALEHFRRGRATRGEHIVERLRDLGIDITFDDVAHEMAEDGRGAVGRPHVARVLVRKGAARDIADAFDRFLGEGRAAYVPKAKLTGVEAIDLVHEAGGVAVLAHPVTLPDPVRETIVRRLAAAGLDGLEVEYPKHADAEREAFGRLADELGLVVTGGSDFHGENKPDVELGTGIGNNILVPPAVLDALRTRAAANARAPR